MPQNWYGDEISKIRQMCDIEGDAMADKGRSGGLDQSSIGI